MASKEPAPAKKFIEARLNFFNCKAIGEPIRFLLSYFGIHFEDVRVTKEEWKGKKHLMPVEQLPTLEINGKVIYQHLAICRYLIRRYDPSLWGPEGSQDMVDSIIYDILDMWLECNRWWKRLQQCPNHQTQSRTYRKIMRQKDDMIHKFQRIYFAQWEQRLYNHLWLAGEKITCADLYFSAMIESIEDCFNIHFFTIDDVSVSPLDLLIKRVQSLPGIREYLMQRPTNQEVNI